MCYIAFVPAWCSCSFREISCSESCQASCRARSSIAKSTTESNPRNLVALFLNSTTPMIRSAGNMLLARQLHHNHCTNTCACVVRRTRSVDRRPRASFRNNCGPVDRCVEEILLRLPYSLPSELAALCNNLHCVG